MKQRVRIEPNRVIILCLGESAEGCPGSYGSSSMRMTMEVRACCSEVGRRERRAS